MFQWLEALRKEAAVIKAAPWSFGFGAFAIAGLLFVAFQWGYGRENSFLKTQIEKYEKLGGTPDDIRKRISTLEERTLGRNLSDEARAKFIAALTRNKSIKSKVTIVVTCEECFDFGEQIKAAVSEAGWEAELATGVGYALRGLKLSWTQNGTRKPVTTAFGDALASAGLQYETINNPAFNQPTLFIGRRDLSPRSDILR